MGWGDENNCFDSACVVIRGSSVFRHCQYALNGHLFISVNKHLPSSRSAITSILFSFYTFWPLVSHAGSHTVFYRLHNAECSQEHLKLVPLSCFHHRIFRLKSVGPTLLKPDILRLHGCRVLSFVESVTCRMGSLPLRYDMEYLKKRVNRAVKGWCCRCPLCSCIGGGYRPKMFALRILRCEQSVPGFRQRASTIPLTGFRKGHASYVVWSHQTNWLNCLLCNYLFTIINI